MLLLLVLTMICISSVALAQGTASNTPATAACTFQSGAQMSVRYERMSVEKNKSLPNDEMWPRKESPMYLFTQSEVTVEGSRLPTGAYRIYVIPQKKTWTLIINKGVSADAAYDQQQDVARVPMETGQLSTPESQVEVALGHSAPKQCSMRIYYGKTGAFVDFKEQ